MTVNVLMPVYNTPLEYIKQAVDSVWAQTFEKFNLIVVDDNNPKGELTRYLYDELAKRTCCVTVVRTGENKGVAAALDFGLQFCSGDIILRMDSDDIAHREWITKQVQFFEYHPQTVICGVQIRLFSDNGDPRESYHPFQVTKEYARSKPGYWITNHPGIAYRRKVVMALGGYGDTPARFAEDYALWIKFLNAGHIIYNLQEVLMDYRLPDDPQKIVHRRSREWLDFLQDQKKLLYEK